MTRAAPGKPFGVWFALACQCNRQFGRSGRRESRSANPMEPTWQRRMLQGSVQDFRRSSSWSAPPAIFPGGSSCPACSICAAPASSRNAGSSACRWTGSTPTASAPSPGKRSTISGRKIDEAKWADFAAILDYVPISAGAGALKAAVEAAEQSIGRREPAHPLSERAAQRRPVRGAYVGRGRSRRPAASSWRSPSAPISPAPSR